MNRPERRKLERQLESLKKKAKEDMYQWVLDINRDPTQAELDAWKAGYIHGVNRATGLSNA
jgi:hypothetical protein